MRADDLLIGPRGQYLCWAMTAPDAAFTPAGALAALADATAMAAYWQQPIEHHLVRPDVDLLPVAERLVAGGGTAGWSEPIARAQQHLVVLAWRDRELKLPALTGVTARLDAVTEQHAHPIPAWDGAGPVDWQITSGIWWSAPIGDPNVRTTHPVSGVPLGVSLVEDLDPTEARSWAVRIADSARILELAHPQDWVDLVRRYPLDVSSGKRGDWWRATGRDGGWLIPDWAAVAADWDGVHLTIAGYLTTAGRALDVDDRFATVLAGWDPDTTYWLNDVVQLAGDAVDWTRDEASNEWRPAR